MTSKVETREPSGSEPPSLWNHCDRLVEAFLKKVRQGLGHPDTARSLNNSLRGWCVIDGAKYEAHKVKGSEEEKYSLYTESEDQEHNHRRTLVFFFKRGTMTPLKIEVIDNYMRENHWFGTDITFEGGKVSSLVQRTQQPLFFPLLPEENLGYQKVEVKRTKDNNFHMRLGWDGGDLLRFTNASVSVDPERQKMVGFHSFDSSVHTLILAFGNKQLQLPIPPQALAREAVERILNFQQAIEL